MGSSGRSTLTKSSPGSKRKNCLSSITNNVATEEKPNSLSCRSPDLLNSHSGIEVDDDCTSGSTVNPLYEMLTEKSKLQGSIFYTSRHSFICISLLINYPL